MNIVEWVTFHLFKSTQFSTKNLFQQTTHKFEKNHREVLYQEKKKSEFLEMK